MEQAQLRAIILILSLNSLNNPEDAHFYSHFINEQSKAQRA